MTAEFFREVGLHSPTIFGFAIVGFLIGVFLIILGRKLHKRGEQDRSVSVGRDNTGTIITGDVTQVPGTSADTLSKVASWATIIGLVIAIINVILVALAWRLPVAP